MFVAMKALDDRGTEIVDLIVDGYESQYVGQDPAGRHLFRAGSPDVFGLYQRRLAAAEPNWTSHVDAALHD